MALSYKFETMLKILNRINRGDQANAESLADDFAVTRRTMERYIETLRNAGFPIQHDRSQGCYVFGEGYRRMNL